MVSRRRILLHCLSIAPAVAFHVARAQPPAVAASSQKVVPVAVPSIGPIAPRQIQIGDSLRIPLIVDDVQPGTSIEFRLDGAPPSARVTGGALRWRPLRPDAGSSYSVVVHALSMGNEIARAVAEISVTNSHRPPIIRQPADRVIPPGDSLTVPLEASDPDGDALSVAVTNQTDPSLPPRYDARTGTLAWQAPAGTRNRVYVWHITVSDGDGGSATTEIHVAVRSQNVAPVCGPMRSYRTDEGERVEIALDADDANGDSLSYHPLATLPNGVLHASSYEWNIPFGFVLPTRQDSTVRFEWKATDPSQASTGGNCIALVTVFRSIADTPFRALQARHHQLVADVRSELENYAVRERATRDSVSTSSSRKRAVKRASLASALMGGLLQIAKSEDTRRIAAGVSATLTVGLSGWESTLEDGGPLANRAEVIAQQRGGLQRALSRFLRKYGETVSRESLLGPAYEGDHLELFDLLASTGRAGGGWGAAASPPP